MFINCQVNSFSIIYRSTSVQLRRISLRFCPLRYVSSSARQRPSQSYFFQPGTSSLLNLRVGDLVNRAADDVGDDTAFVSCHQGVRKTFSEFKTLVDKLASGLIALGLSRGDRVALCAPNLYEWPVVQYATAKAGLIMVNINPAYQTEELEYCLRKVGCSAFIVAESFKMRNYYEMVCSIVPELTTAQCGSLVAKKLPNLKSVILIGDQAQSGTLTFDNLLSAGDSRSNHLLSEVEGKIQFDDAVDIQFTSGTTGSPKAATLSHHNVVNNAYQIGRRMGFHQQKPVLCCQVPLYHCFGCVLGSVTSVLYQFPCVFPAPRFNASETVKAIQKEKCTTVYGTPTMFVDVINLHKSMQNKDLDTLKQILVSGAACPQSVLTEMYDELKVPNIHIAYGCTENSPVVSITGMEENRSTVFSRHIKPLEHLEFKVIDDDGLIVPIGNDGELCVRGYVQFLGYWDQDDKTAEVIDRARWFHTGDLVKMQDSGHLEIIGRKKDMIIRGGENIYPQEVENLLHKHPIVLEAHVCGVSDHRMGEELCAWVQLKDKETHAEDDIRNFCKGKISHFKIPRYFMFVDDFPKTVTGKVQKFRMRQISTEKLKLQ